MSDQSRATNTTVVIDGPAGAGKSTVARRVARRLGYMLLATGAIYRTLALAAREAGVDWGDSEGLASLAAELPIRFSMEQDVNRVLLGERDVSEAIRTPEMSLGASRVSALGPVREALLELQRQFARSTSVVAEGRDMGTVVFTDARVKIFLVADPEVRARRRLLELLSREELYPLQMARELGISPTGVMKHLNLLEEAGLVGSRSMSSPQGPPRKVYASTAGFAIRVAVGPNTFEQRIVRLTGDATLPTVQDADQGLVRVQRHRSRSGETIRVTITENEFAFLPRHTFADGSLLKPG